MALSSHLKMLRRVFYPPWCASRSSSGAFMQLSVAIVRRVPLLARFQSTSGTDPKLEEIVEKLKANPEISEILQGFQATLVAKGFDPLKPPSMMEMMRLFALKDVRDQAAKLKTKLDEAGIAFSPENVSLFMNVFKK